MAASLSLSRQQTGCDLYTSLNQKQAPPRQVGRVPKMVGGKVFDSPCAVSKCGPRTAEVALRMGVPVQQIDTDLTWQPVPQAHECVPPGQQCLHCQRAQDLPGLLKPGEDRA